MYSKHGLKGFVRHLIQKVGGPKSAAEIIKRGRSEISWWQNDNHPRFIPIDCLVELDAVAGDIFLKEWARLRGYELTSRDAQANIAPSVIKAVAELSRHSGELEFTTLDAVEDGNITPAERRRIQDRIAPVKDKIAQLEAAIS